MTFLMSSINNYFSESYKYCDNIKEDTKYFRTWIFTLKYLRADKIY